MTMPPMTARYSAREQRERGRDVALGATVAGTGVGMNVARRNLTLAQMRAGRAAARNAPPLLYGGKPYPKTARFLARLGAGKGVKLGDLAAMGILGLTAGTLRRRMRDQEDKRIVAKADTKPSKAGLGAAEYKSQFVYGLPVHQARSLSPSQRSEALARTMGVWSAPLAPKGERARTTVSQGAALGTAGAVGLTAGGLAAGLARKNPKAALSALKNVGKPKAPKGLAGTNPKAYANARPTPKQRLSQVASAANPKTKIAQTKAALRDPTRRADLARGAATAAVTTPVAGVLSAAAANRTVNRSPEAQRRWKAQDKKVLDMVTKGASLAEISKRDNSRRARRARHDFNATMLGGVAGAGALGTAGAVDMAQHKRGISRIDDAIARNYGRAARQSRLNSRISADSAARLATENLNEPQGVLRQFNNKQIVRHAEKSSAARSRARQHALDSRAARADSVRSARSASRWTKGAVGSAVLGTAALGGAIHQQRKANALKGKSVRKSLAEVSKASRNAREQMARINASGRGNIYTTSREAARTYGQQGGRLRAMPTRARQRAQAMGSPNPGQLMARGAEHGANAKAALANAGRTGSVGAIGAAPAPNPTATPGLTGEMRLNRAKRAVRTNKGKLGVLGAAGTVGAGYLIGKAYVPPAWAAIVKDMDPAVDPQAFVEEVRERNGMLRDGSGRFLGKVIDDPGAAVIATPYEEDESA